MTNKSLRVGGLVAFALLTAWAFPAHATHKSWVIRDIGSTCFPDHTQFGYNWNGRYNNTTSPRGTAICPVSVTGMSASDSPAFPIPVWAAAREGKVFVYDNSTTEQLSCSASAMTNTGSVYWSITAYAPLATTGYRTVMLNSNSTDWGSTLGTGVFAPTVTLRMLQYYCTLPNGSQILGHETSICQRSANCFN